MRGQPRISLGQACERDVGECRRDLHRLGEADHLALIGESTDLHNDEPVIRSGEPEHGCCAGRAQVL